MKYKKTNKDNKNKTGRFIFALLIIKKLPKKQIKSSILADFKTLVKKDCRKYSILLELHLSKTLNLVKLNYFNSFLFGPKGWKKIVSQFEYVL